MPNMPIILPKTFAIILLASAGNEVSSFMTQLPEELLIEAQRRAVNFGIQYGAIAIGQAAVGSRFVDPCAPKQLFLQGLESLATASSPVEAATKGTITASLLVLSSAASADPNASLTFGGFLLVLAQNVLLHGSQFIFSNGLLTIYVINNILIKIITEIRVERKRKQLGLPRARLKFNIFRNIFRKEKRLCF